MRSRSETVDGRAIILIAILLAALAAATGCSALATARDDTTAAQPGSAIVVEWWEPNAAADASAQSSVKEIAPAAVGIAGILMAADPLLGALAYGLTTVGRAAVEQNKGGGGVSQTITVPTLAGQPSLVVRKPDGMTIVWTGVAPPTALTEAMTAVLDPADADLYQRVMAASQEGGQPQPPTIKPK